MAGSTGVAGACEAIVRLLRAEHRDVDFGGAALEFRVCTASEFTRPMAAGVSALLYRVSQDRSWRQMAPGAGPEGRREAAETPLELHVLLTAWAPQAGLQHEIAGWLLRTLHDHAVLPASLLNEYRADVFLPGESVEVVPMDLSAGELGSLWRTLTQEPYQLSIAVLVRGLRIAGRTAAEEGAGR
jgi:hypothetical protein